MKSGMCIILLTLIFAAPANAKARKLDDFHWVDVDRVVAISDLHGDYEQYLAVMQSAGLIDNKGKWIGGETHMVQTGDITDRGPDSRKIIDHLVKLAKQATRKGGYIHMLIGNHEVMNVTGDLRYVTRGEFDAFRSRSSERLQELQWKHQLEWMKSNDPEGFAVLDLDNFRKEWEQNVPLGWVEHRQAWSLSGDYGAWVKDNQVAVQINDTIFLHGGISSKYCKFTLESLTTQVIEALQNADPTVLSIAEDPLGPLWYRGLAQESEEGVFSRTLDNILNRYGARRIVVGHSPTGGVVWPRFDQRVIVNDTGIAAYYGSHEGVLELTTNGAVAIYGDHKIPIPADAAGRIDYLRAVIEVDSHNALLKNRLTRMLAPPEQGADGVTGQTGDEADAAAEAIPGTCQ